MATEPRKLASAVVRRRRNREAMLAFKDAPCMDCGGRFPSECMDFDHVRGRKYREVALLAGSDVSLRVLLDEILKCDLVCSNCHRIRTAARRRST